jgi:CDP-diacylglycerol--glycerol-3-phosphate 3-phosphatidyltransferase
MRKPAPVLKPVPYLLISLRLVLGPTLLIDSLDGETNFWFVLGMLIALGSDYFDGVIARRLGLATKELRQADSYVDTFFLFCVAASLWFAHQEVVITFGAPLVVMFSLHILSIFYPLIKFGKFPAYHAYSAKVAGLFMILAVVVLFGYGPVGWLLWAAVILGSFSHLERIVISYMLPELVNDVSGVWQAARIRREFHV